MPAKLRCDRTTLADQPQCETEPKACVQMHDCLDSPLLLLTLVVIQASLQTLDCQVVSLSVKKEDSDKIR